jgi:hypothetical protein
VQRGDNGEDNAKRDDVSGRKSRAFRMMEERLERRRRSASLGRLISYIIALILVILLILLFRSRGM